MAYPEGSSCADLALLAPSREADDSFGSFKGRPSEHRPSAPPTYRQIYIDWSLQGTRAGAIASASPYAEPGRSYVDLDHGIFYRKPIGKRPTKKRQTPAPIPPRLLAHLRRWSDRKLIATSFVEFNGKPVASVKKGFNGRGACPSAGQRHTTYAAPHRRHLADAEGSSDLGGCRVLGNVPRDPPGDLRPPSS